MKKPKSDSHIRSHSHVMCITYSEQNFIHYWWEHDQSHQNL